MYRTMKRRGVFAARIRGGMIVGGQEANGTRLPPPQERLYAGGPTTVRGFQQNQLGPQVYLLDDNGVTVCKGDSLPWVVPSVAQATASQSPYYVLSNGKRQQRSIPTGGNLLAVLNAELRI